MMILFVFVVCFCVSTICWACMRRSWDWRWPDEPGCAVLFLLDGTKQAAFEVPVLLSMVCAGALGGSLSVKLHRGRTAGMADKLYSALLGVIFLICYYNALMWM